MSLEAGQIVDGKYRIVRVLGVGGMGAVYEGENTRIHRKVAIKVLHASVAQKADIVQRFEREAQAAGRIGSEHIVEVLDLGNLPGGERYMVMEFLDGEPLTNRIKVRGRLAPADTAELLRQLLAGLGAAHQVGIVHRDLKPDNIFLIKRSGYDFVKLVDFGVSKFTNAGEDMSMTKTGAVMGTPYYMSPEQARGQPIDHRSDLYSVGVVAYQCVTGRVPFNAETFNELIFKIALEAPEPVENVVPGFDTNFAALIRKAMEREVMRRFQSAAEFAQAVESWRAGMGFAGQASPQAMQAMRQTGTNPQIHAPGYGAPQHPLGQSGSNPAMQVPHLGQSGSNPAMQVPHLGQSGSNPNFQAPHLAQSGSSLQAMGMQQLAPPPPAPNGQLAQSQVALAVTSGQQKSKSGLLAVVGVMAVLGAGGGFAAYRYLGAQGASAGQPASTAVATGAPATDTATTATATATSTATPTATAIATAEPTAATTASAEPSAEPTATAAVTSGPATKPTKPGKPEPTAKPAVPTAKPTSGRSIDGSL